MKFRADLNGLRAIAVGSVLCFHFGVQPFRGGFVGVDIFFVLSGFLMTGIIISGLDSGSFRLLDFYVARARRVSPPLLAMVAVLLIGGFFFIEPGSYRDIGQRGGAALLFISDWLFAQSTNYFSDPNENWLLHTWSLSVEWQFYILYPVFVAVVRRVSGPRFVPHALAVCAAASLLVSVYMVQHGGRLGAAAFYTLPSRAWEMLAGGLTYVARPVARYRPRPAMDRICELAGLGAIAVSILLFNSFTAWPSYNALVPVLGTVLVVLSHRGAASLLRFRPFQLLGSSSYSIYIWHWPIVVAAAYSSFSFSGATVAVGLAAAIGTGYLSYVLIERNARYIRPGGIAILAVGQLVAVGLAAVVVVNDGFVGRTAGNLALMTDSLDAPRDWTFPLACDRSLARLPACILGDGTKTRVAIFGDSHAQMLYARFSGAKREDASVEFITSSGCPPLPGVDARSAHGQCLTFHDDAIRQIMSSDVNRVVYASIWTTYLDYTQASGATGCIQIDSHCEVITNDQQLATIFARLKVEIAELVRTHHDVYIVLPFPIPSFDVPKAVRIDQFRADRAEILTKRGRPVIEQKVYDLLNETAAVGAILVDPRPAFCHDDLCFFTDSDGRSYYKDTNHLRASMMSRPILGMLDTLVQPRSDGEPARSCTNDPGGCGMSEAITLARPPGAHLQ